jgi:hypothetical protein
MRKDLAHMDDDELVLLRAGLDAEMRKRNIAFSVGGVGEQLVIEHFRKTPGLPKLQPSERGTKNMDASSRDGERYSIKTICHAKKTGTIYQPKQDNNKQLFEYLLIAKLAEDWSLESIHQLGWNDFVKVVRRHFQTHARSRPIDLPSSRQKCLTFFLPGKPALKS